LNISNVETIHYSTVEFLLGKRLIVAVFHSRLSLKVALQRLIIASIIFFVLFLCLILIISHINILRFRELIGAQKAIISSLAELTEGRDPETGRHLERTRNYCVILAKQLRKSKKYRKIITDEFIEDLYEASPLHDIGKVGIRDAVLLKEGKLTQEEYEEMKKHVIIGKQVLQHAIDKFKLKQSFFIVGRNICAYHHEKFNGKGYPEGLKGDEIPMEARIFALCDAYDAIRSKRPYKNELSHEEAVKRIKAESGEHFDPNIVDAFLKCERKFLEISETYKD
jgi:putative two-component system response regulator